MSLARSAIGVVALWATFCVVLLAVGWLSTGATSGAQHGPGRLAPQVATTAMASDAGQKAPSLPCPDAPASENSAKGDKSGDAEPERAAAPLPLRRNAWVAVMPLWPADALRWQRMEPSLRLNPGHAPPNA
ncbi:hypothetical protein [Stenotrophomonas sp.]|uniref:hypothetical protein n=1 Tax=Stenotrophomonas sp. TaxID=69392 RepID=UPI00289E5F9B|nr:hypothetical protein [Stenotrophomonas sp.]